MLHRPQRPHLSGMRSTSSVTDEMVPRLVASNLSYFHVTKENACLTSRRRSARNFGLEVCPATHRFGRNRYSSLMVDRNLKGTRHSTLFPNYRNRIRTVRENLEALGRHWNCLRSRRSLTGMTSVTSSISSSGVLICGVARTDGKKIQQNGTC